VAEVEIVSVTQPRVHGSPAPRETGAEAVATWRADGADSRAERSGSSAVRSGAVTRLLAGLRAWLPFLMICVAPSATAIAYFGFIAADRYVAQAEFVVRSAERNSVSALGALLQSTGLDSAQDKALLVSAYMLSHDALRKLETGVGFSSRMGGDRPDFLAGYPNPLDGETFEELHDYYQRRVTVTNDLTKGTTLLKVSAFTPEDAATLATELLALGERFVNDMNERAQNDALALARREVALGEQRVIENQKAFNALRREQGLVDPSADTELQLKLVASLSAELATRQARLSRLTQDSPASPQIPPLNSEIDALSRQIERERTKLIGRDSALIDSFGAFETLTLERTFATEALLAAQAGLEQARSDVTRQQLYLEPIYSPTTPDYAREPERMRLIAAVIAGSLLIYAVVWLLYANAREHRT